MKTREELLNQLGKPSMPIEITGYVDRIEQERVETNLVLVTNDEIHDILQAPTQTQLDCPYCHGKADLNDTTNSNFVINLDMFDENEPRLEINYEDEFVDYDSILIHFCPMCGRKLGDE